MFRGPYPLQEDVLMAVKATKITVHVP